MGASPGSRALTRAAVPAGRASGTPPRERRGLETAKAPGPGEFNPRGRADSTAALILAPSPTAASAGCLFPIRVLTRREQTPGSRTEPFKARCTFTIAERTDPGSQAPR